MFNEVKFLIVTISLLSKVHSPARPILMPSLVVKNPCLMQLLKA